MDNPTTQGNSHHVAPCFGVGVMVSRNATMTSEQLAELLQIEHNELRKKANAMAAKGLLEFREESARNPLGGRPRLVMHFDKRNSMVIAAKLNDQLLAAVVDRWIALEQPASSLQIPQNYSEALRLAADLSEQNNHLQLVVSEQAPKVEALERISQARGTMCLTDAAKHLGVQRKQLLEWMREHRWIYRREGSTRWVAYQPREAAGLLEHKVTVLGTEDDGEQRLASQVRVTPKGLAMLAQKIGGVL
ncbi:phage antirepressor KilAC domain-containing protein [Pseudomonas sp.]|uniref:phage antirepressor KilAC domain-containing protein n=1 Tax=Pseudomonas sp. TaxID=306 RepID=UPI0027321E57|nr:phage antirepressor KilAC domain-containing protein [Pseudomonas sp.]MDP2244038.1 phage antirepressor KilAC domain-containing protein [Pseudomonas sp.]